MMPTILQRLEHWLARNRPHYLAALQPGAVPAEIDELRARMKVPLPSELIALLSWHNGQIDDAIARFEEDWMLMSAGQIASAREELTRDRKETGWESAWIPFLDDDAGGYLFLDTGKQAGGSQFAPVRGYWPGQTNQDILSPSLEKWLEEFVTQVEKGNYLEDPERGRFMRKISG